jgi:putative transposase
MSVKRKQHSATFKARVALEALKGRKTTNEIASEYQIHPNLVTKWKSQLQQQAAALFGAANRREDDQKAAEELQAQLYQQIGQLKVELAPREYPLKKNLARSLEEKRRLIEPDNTKINISRQCELLELTRPNYYYRPRPISELNSKLMRRLDEIYTDFPYFGILKMTACLQNEGFAINHKRIERLMGEMGHP